MRDAFADLSRIPILPGPSNELRAERQCFQYRAADFAQSSESNSLGLILACECLPRIRAHAKNNHVRKWPTFSQPTRGPVCPASRCGEYDSLEIHSIYKVYVLLTRARYFYLESAACFRTGLPVLTYPILFAFCGDFVNRLIWELCDKPLHSFELICRSRPANLNQKLFQVRANEGRILRAFVADRANGAEI